jgi:hypothetical protein
MASEMPLRVFLVEDSPSVRDRLIDFLAEPGKVDVIGFADTKPKRSANCGPSPSMSRSWI